MKLIVAVDKSWGIGKEGNLLCHLPGDLKYFKEKTLGKTVVMGRKTLESLPGGKPLPGRRNIVLSRDIDFSKEGCIVVNDIDTLVDKYMGDDLMVIGGGCIYDALLKYCDTCYVTKLEAKFDADVSMTNLDEADDFCMTWKSETQEENNIVYYFTEYKRIKNGE